MSTIAVIVTYHPDHRVCEEIAALLGQVSRILVVDNGSPDEELRALAFSDEDPLIELIRLSANFGIGAAHNIGIRRAKELGASHVMLMDQDSMPSRNMVANLLAAEQALLTMGRNVGAVGPVYHDSRLGKSFPFFKLSRFGVRACECAGERYIACDLLISSGTLIRISVLEEIGSMNEAYFLEHVDTEWSLRARFAGYALFGVCDARMDHTLGDDTISVPLTGRQVQIYHPYRHYYLFRNAMVLWRQRYAVLPWKLNETKRLILRLVFFSIFVSPRKRRLWFMVLGLWHGFLRRSGPLKT